MTGNSTEAALTDAVALVTGGGQVPPGINIGHAISVALARAGSRVVVADVSQAAATETVNAIEALGGEAHAVVCDVAREADCQAAIAQTVERTGGLDVLVNSVGIEHGAPQVEDTEIDDWDHVVDVNLRGAMLMAKHAYSVFREGGAIVNISSIAAMRPAPQGSVAYAAAKGGLEALTRVLAVHTARKRIRVTCVSPGMVWTPMVARLAGPEHADAVRRNFCGASLLRTEGTAWDIADAVVFLASARWITGQVLTVDGGGGLVRPAPLAG